MAQRHIWLVFRPLLFALTFLGLTLRPLRLALRLRFALALRTLWLHWLMNRLTDVRKLRAILQDFVLHWGRYPAAKTLNSQSSMVRGPGTL